MAIEDDRLSVEVYTKDAVPLFVAPFPLIFAHGGGVPCSMTLALDTVEAKTLVKIDISVTSIGVS